MPVSLMNSYLTVKFVWDKSPKFQDLQRLGDRAFNDTAALNARSRRLASPLALKVPQMSQSSIQDAHTLTRHLVQSARGRFILQLESPPFEWWKPLLELCQHIPAGGVLQVSRPQCARTKTMDIVKWELLCAFKGLDRLCFLNDIEAEDSCARTVGAFFASFFDRCRTQLKFLLYDIFSIASLVNLYDSLANFDASPYPTPQFTKRIDAKQLKTVFVLVPFKFDRDSQLSAAPIPDVASLVGRLFAEERLEVTDATLVVWACYPRELVDCGDHSETAIRSQLRKELEPHIERLRELAPIPVSECGESRRVPPFRKVDLRVCPYEEWHAGGIAEIPVEVWEEVLAGIEADGASSSGASAEARAGEART